MQTSDHPEQVHVVRIRFNPSIFHSEHHIKKKVVVGGGAGAGGVCCSDWRNMDGLG